MKETSLTLIRKGDLDYRQAAASACCIWGPFATPR